MHTSSRATILFLALVSPSPLLAADDTPRAVVERAIRACGAPADQSIALSARYRLLVLKSPFAETDTDDPRFTVTIAGDTQGNHARMDLDDTTRGQHEMTMALSAKGGWTADAHQATPMDKNRLEMFKQATHAQRVTWLTPLLHDKKFELSSLGESKFEGKTVLGIKVVYPERADVRLFFDKETGLLTKAESEWSKSDVYTQVFRNYHTVDGSEASEKLLREAKLETDGDALIKHLGRYMPAAERAAELTRLIEELGDDSYEVREKASRTLREIGKPALPWLRKAGRSTDLEIVDRARRVVEALGGDQCDSETTAVIRLLGYRKPNGAAEVLLAYLTEAARPSELREVRAALAAVAYRDGKADPSLLKALEEKGPRRRNALAALGRDKSASTRDPGRRLYLPPLKVAQKIEYLQGEKTQFSMELLDLQFFNQHEEGLFEAPAPKTSSSLITTY
jgi:hypothetical protein